MHSKAFLVLNRILNTQVAFCRNPGGLCTGSVSKILLENWKNTLVNMNQTAFPVAILSEIGK